VTDADDRFERCSTQAALRGDPMIGSAFPADRLLLVEQPGPWGRTGLLASRFDSAVAHRLVARLEARGVRVVAIRRPGRHQPAGARQWAAVDCRPGRERAVWGHYDDDRQLLELDVPGVLDGSVPGGASDPLYLVCAHGTHDACCAIRGRPVAAALAARRPGRVWECSHVGGDRFAANVLVLPAGLLYGRMLPEGVDHLVMLTDGAGVDAPALRGRIGFSSAEQAAMVLAHQRYPAAGWREVEVLGVDRSRPHRPVVTLSVAGAELAVLVDVQRAEPSWLTCQAGSPGRALTYRPSLLPG
jgi:hypothetical protein